MPRSTAQPAGSAPSGAAPGTTGAASSPSAAPSGAPRHEMPFTRLELAVLGLVDGALHVLLARRAGEPYKGRWALPGGALRIDLDASLEHGAQRVSRERMGREMPYLRQLCAVGGPGRDKARTPWALSVVYRAVVDPGQLDVTAGKRVEALAWCPVVEAAADRQLAFDHAELIARAVVATRQEVRALDLPGGFIPATFTLGELQALCEQMLGERLDKSSFRRRLGDRDLVEPVEGEMRTGANRPAQVFRLR